SLEAGDPGGRASLLGDDEVVGGGAGDEHVFAAAGGDGVLAGIGDDQVVAGIAGNIGIGVAHQRQVLDVGRQRDRVGPSHYRVDAAARRFDHLGGGVVDDVGVVERPADQRDEGRIGRERVVLGGTAGQRRALGAGRQVVVRGCALGQARGGCRRRRWRWRRRRWRWCRGGGGRWAALDIDNAGGDVGEA